MGFRPRGFLMSSLLAVALLTGCSGPRATTSRIILLGLDGVDPDVVDQLVSEGRLPNFARLAREGIAARLHSPPPLLSPVIWTTIATGREPADHGIGHFTSVDPETGSELPVTSSMRRVKALWNLFSEADRRVAVVGWWATWPAEPVAGVVVSDRAGFHFLMGQEMEAGGVDDRAIYPPAARAGLLPLIRRPGDVDHDELRAFAQVEPEALQTEFDFDDDLSHLRWALAAAGSYRDIGLRLWREERPDLLMLYIEGVDTASHLFGHLYRQEGLAGELAEQQARYGRTVEAMYELADGIVGSFLEVADERTTLMVVSDHGFELGRLGADPSKTRDMRRVSEEYHREEGILYLFGAGIEPGIELGAGSPPARTIDVTPTALALAGLPVAEDMAGRVLPVLPAGRRVERIASYESGRPAGGATPGEEREAAVDAALLEKLESLGYLGGGGSAPAGGGDRASKNDRNLASMLLRDGRYAEAVTAFERILERDPQDAVARMSLGTALGGLERGAAALAELDRALELDPLLVPAHHNRGLVLERLGRTAEAVASFQKALRYDAEYAPSREALERLGAPLAARLAETPQERRSAGLLAQAAEAVKRGDYAGAQGFVDEARELTPAAAVVYQYEANVAYLRGDRAAAIRALEKGLELEPDNALLRANLRRLRG